MNGTSKSLEVKASHINLDNGPGATERRALPLSRRTIMVRFGRSMSSQAQIASLRDPQTVPVDDQPDQPIPVTVPVALEGAQQLVHFGLGQMLPDPVGIVLTRALRWQKAELI
jgi:hypothetical protein